MSDQNNIWLFGYGSLIWRPGFSYHVRRPARIHGYARRFWQGSHDHRGSRDAPGRVVTLIAMPGSHCAGVAYLISNEVAEEAFIELDHREKNGYLRQAVDIFLSNGDMVRGLVYIASERNHAFLGPASLAKMAKQIAASEGPSGSNTDYLFQLAAALREMGAVDAHVFELESAVRAINR